MYIVYWMFEWIISIALQTREKFSTYMLIKYVEFIIECNCVLSHRKTAVDEVLYLYYS